MQKKGQEISSIRNRKGRSERQYLDEGGNQAIRGRLAGRRVRRVGGVFKELFHISEMHPKQNVQLAVG